VRLAGKGAAQTRAELDATAAVAAVVFSHRITTKPSITAGVV
jgi:hypothetical protein